MLEQFFSRLLQEQGYNATDHSDQQSDTGSSNIVIDTSTVREESSELKQESTKDDEVVERPASQMSEKSAASTSKAQDDLAFEDIEEATIETADSSGFKPIETSSEKEIPADENQLIVSTSSTRAVAVAASISQLVLQVLYF